MNMRNKAFTLIELLVVISIIAILTAIALPAFRGVQERAHGLQDANNLKQLGIGFVAYPNDHDDTIMTTASLAATSGTSWAMLIGPAGTANYVSDWHVFQSPFDKRPFANQNVSYGMNTNIAALTTGSNTTTTFNHPSELMLLGPDDTGAYPNISFSAVATTNTTVAPGSIAGYMNNGTNLNVLFQDGHGATMKASDFNNSSYNVNTGSGGNGQSQFWQPGAN